ncbi:MarR family winged helix-turn-helix transcriptional regulator [Pseudooceanicola nanhaiensis]|uniref:MarR family winged helix-turn-helix transcriptional regulator n=1 Tax=Pseudooceanicola nanhaiensis TaxID=375761 RepID=UPI001CD39839|nr:MarR family transcriptional regulator [Pseudooceanicola nanhaiensis]MCA0918796.1 MarR family transcriptional regulator [Pseudooceanicola nanhaiensis]
MEVYDMAGHLIRRLHQTSANVFSTRTKAEGFDITPVQFAAMGAIRDNPGIDQAGVAAMIAYDRATIGGVLDRLEHKKWVSRSVSSKDRRAREVTLTETGEEMFSRVLPVVRKLQEDILPGLSDEERSAFLTLARKAASEAAQA